MRPVLWKLLTSSLARSGESRVIGLGFKRGFGLASIPSSPRKKTEEAHFVGQPAINGWPRVGPGLVLLTRSPILCVPEPVKMPELRKRQHPEHLVRGYGITEQNKSHGEDWEEKERGGRGVGRS